MMADPIAPGRGLPVYQPTTVVVLGTCSVPFRLRPRLVIRALTPMAGMVRKTGLAVCCWTADSESGAIAGPEGAATGVSRTEGGGEARATTRPAAPPPTANSPAPSIAADSSRACAPHTAEARAATRNRTRPAAPAPRRPPPPLRPAGALGPADAPTPARALRPAPLAPEERRDTHKPMVLARIRPQDGSAATPGDAAGTGTACDDTAGTGTACSAGADAAAPPGLVERAGSAAPADVTTCQGGPLQSASTSQPEESGWDVVAGMVQQSTPAGPVSTETLSCVPHTTVRYKNK